MVGSRAVDLPICQREQDWEHHLDTQRLRASFERAAAHGDEFVLFFYSHLFSRNPGLRELFPVSMVEQRGRFLTALDTIVSGIDDLSQVTPYLQQLGRDHWRFGVLEQYYAPVGTSLLATLAHFCGDSWTPALAADWEAVYAIISRVMIEATPDDTDAAPGGDGSAPWSWWRRTPSP